MGESAAEQDATPAVTAPFKALIAGWSLIVVVLSVAGYSYRWNYYYNFGLQSLVLAAALESLPVYAIEIARSREFVADLLWLALLYLVPFRVALLALKKARDARNERVSKAAQFFTRLLALENRLLIEAVAAALIVLIAFRAGGEAGYRAYMLNVVEGTSKLPQVTAIARGDSQDSPLPIRCDTRTFKDSDSSKTPPFLGEPGVITSLRAGAACSTNKWSWRLLLRDERYVYVFATVQDRTQRPQTLILPNSEALTFVLR